MALGCFESTAVPRFDFPWAGTVADFEQAAVLEVHPRLKPMDPPSWTAWPLLWAGVGGVVRDPSLTSDREEQLQRTQSITFDVPTTRASGLGPNDSLCGSLLP